MNRPVFLGCLFLVSIIPLSAQHPERIRAEDIRPEKELLITNPTVVDSDLAKYPGPWSFGGLVEELVGRENAPDAVLQLLECYSLNSRPGQSPKTKLPLGNPSLSSPRRSGAKDASPPTVDPVLLIPARPDITRNFIIPWQKRDGYDPASGKGWRPNLANAPFRLLAIVNRMDLGASSMVGLRDTLEDRWKRAGREKEFGKLIGLATNGVAVIPSTPSIGSFGGWGGGLVTSKEPTEFGEGRLVFGAVGPDGRPLEGGWTIIFEYKLEAMTKVGRNKPNQPTPSLTARDWAQAWHWLGSLEFSDPRYLAELEKITRAFTHRPVDEKGEFVNGGAPTFSQLRSNEAAFGPGREFRQFSLQEGAFVPALLPLTPAPEFLPDTPNGGRLLSSFLRKIEPLIVAGIHSLPATVHWGASEHTLLGGRAVIPAGERDFHWEPQPPLSREARRLFSMSTCNGCHAAETGCSDGLHVHPRAAGEAATVSAFLRTDGQPNNVRDPGQRSAFIRLREMGDRAEILAAFLQPKESRRSDALTDVVRERLRRSH